jgi:hypothetical protein
MMQATLFIKALSLLELQQYENMLNVESSSLNTNNWGLIKANEFRSRS